MKLPRFLLTTLFLTVASGATLLAQAAEDQPPAREQGSSQFMMMMGVTILFAYFLLWRPERKKQKALAEQRNSLKAGDRDVAMGILGTVVNVKENSVVLRMYDGSKIEVLKAAISDAQPVTVEAEEKIEKIQG